MYVLVALTVILIGAFGLVGSPALMAAPSGRATWHEAASRNVHFTQPPVTQPAPATNSSPPPSGGSGQSGPAGGSSSPAGAAAPAYGCAAALAYLAGHANPEFTSVCPGYADGNEAMTCVNVVGLCGGEHVIVINDPCPAAYMNEAYNSQSWSDAEGTFTRPIDPYGSC